ncbi:MAG TPA: acyl-CoA dehydratase activase-related protein, partial [Opitutaceae bacterium]|nr:acyl-CoA dehydratase activase-related protein [Opitutaceae bacterium]
VLEHVPGLRDSGARVRRLPPVPPAAPGAAGVLLGLDIGSTGAKAVALDVEGAHVVWETYRPTAGDPVGAAQALLRTFAEGEAGGLPVRGFGVTGSGREIVGSLLTACYGATAVYVLNEIAAHAEGAHAYDPRVDTIFEIGGQDAKYIRLAEGRVIDCAMNEACSAGTGSFIEEQGGKFSGIRGVAHLAQEAMAADEGISLGQHCSVFMAEVIDGAVAAGAPPRSIIAGLYDSVVQNYLNRVKGSRSVGQVVFCQGMPFASDALAAAVARQTGAEVIVPPNPGTVGAFGIALLARRALAAGAPGDAGAAAERKGFAVDRFLQAKVEGKDTFHCKATVGCGGAGNRCRIERLRTVVAGKALGFTWGGGCALHDKATRKKKLPDRAPDPFREREELVRTLLASRYVPRGRTRVALTDEFALKELYPFFAAFVHELGFDLAPTPAGELPDLKRGIRSANVPFCAPMQLYHGLVGRMAETDVPAILLPMVRSLPRVDHEGNAVACPIVQASPDLLRWDLAGISPGRLISPVINLDADGIDGTAFRDGCRELADLLGAPAGAWRRAHAVAREVQATFQRGVAELGVRALEFCAANGIVPVIVAGRPYTIYNPVLNSNVPAILREQGAIGIPVDCYPVDAGVPVFCDMYWGYGQRILRAAHQVRRTAGQYSLYCSNYACGPDSFNLHFYAHIMEGKPFAIIETDGHSGDAGTKTRVEAFLHCVEQDRARHAGRAANDFERLQVSTVRLREMVDRRERLLIPWMSDASLAVAAALRGRGVRAESLPPPDASTLRTGRRHTSGKECLPIALTLGGLIQRLERAGPEERFAYLMASTYGPCRFGVYNLLNRIVLGRLGWSERVRIWSPRDTGYFEEFPPAFGMLTFAGIVAADLLNEMVIAGRVAEVSAGAADELYHTEMSELLRLIERATQDTPGTPAALWQVASGELFGIRALLAGAADRFAEIHDGRSRPTVLLVGEIYVRCVPFANGFAAEKLRARGIDVRIAPVREWLAYCDCIAARQRPRGEWGPALSDAVQARIRRVATATVAKRLGWPASHEPEEMLETARPYVSDELYGEAALTIGGPLCAWREGQIDGVLSVGPHECMPNKIAESQFFHVAEREGLPSLTVPVNGEPPDPELFDNFAFEVHARWRGKGKARLGTGAVSRRTPRPTRVAG